MKKLCALVLLILVVIPLLTACGGKQPNEKPNPPQSEIEQTSADLIVNLIKDNTHYGGTLEAFQEVYPGMIVAYAMFEPALGGRIADGLKHKSTEQVMEQVDLLFFDATLLQNENTDIQKMMREGWFADFNEFIAEDSDFNLDDYNQKIMDFGVVDQKRYLLPLSYNIPFVLTTEKAMETSEFDVSQCTDYWGFAQEVERYSQKKTDKSPRIFANPEPMQLFYRVAGMDFWNYDNQSVALDTPELKKAVKNYKLQYVPEVPRVHPGIYGVEHNSALFSFYGSESFETLLNDITLLQQKQKQPVFFPLRTVDGKTRATIDVAVAINKNSPNKLNAYRFAKFMLSEQYQTKTNLRNMPGIPVLNSAVQSCFDAVFSQPREAFLSDGKTELEGLSQDYFTQYLSYLNEISDVTSVTSADSIFHENMVPFYKGEKPYEECIENARTQLQKHMNTNS